MKQIIDLAQQKKVTVVAVSKYQNIDKINQAYNYGFRHFGENILQDAVKKIQQTENLDIIWHFIGTLQSNKMKKIVKYFDWIDSVASEADIIKLDSIASRINKDINICIQIKLCDHENRRACNPQDLNKLIAIIKNKKSINLKGLMILPPANLTEKELTHYFTKAYSIFKSTNLEILSMGMSNDAHIAIESGANMIRIGKAIFDTN